MEVAGQTPGAAPAGSSALVEAAMELARAAHAGQRRKDYGTPYVSHPVSVAEVLAGAGIDDEEVLAAALLHDVVEDTELSSEEIAERFGERVADMVLALTDDESIRDYERRKAEHRARVEAAGPDAASIYVADKLANVRDLRKLYAAIGERAQERFTRPFDVRIRLWREDVEMAERVMPGFSLTGQLAGELDGFEADRAQLRPG